MEKKKNNSHISQSQCGTLNRPMQHPCGGKGTICLIFNRVFLESLGQMVILRY